LIDEEIDQIVKDTNSEGATPTQTLSRVLQELRAEDILHFVGDGVYLLLDTPINIEEVDLSDKAIDVAIEQKKLQLGVVPASDNLALTRQRKGQARIRELILQNYDCQCAFCDVVFPQILIASHISRWADDLNGRGDLSNVICLCRFHDTLFEFGYFSLSDNYQILKKQDISSQMISLLLDSTEEFRLPHRYLPASEYLQKHRTRTGFEV
jgi:predicted restriction endonuclease